MIEIISSDTLPVRAEIEGKTIRLYSNGYLVSTIPFDVEDDDEVLRYAQHLVKSFDGSYYFTFDHIIFEDEDGNKILLRKDVRHRHTILEFVDASSDQSRVAYQITLNDEQLQNLKDFL